MVTHLIITFKSVSSAIISYPPLLSPSLYICFFQIPRQHRTHFPLKVYQIFWRNSSVVYSAFIFSCYNPFLNYKNDFCMGHIQLLFFIFELRQFYVELLFAQYSKSNNSPAFFFMFSSYNLYTIIQLCSRQGAVILGSKKSAKPLQVCCLQIYNHIVIASSITGVCLVWHNGERILTIPDFSCPSRFRVQDSVRSCGSQALCLEGLILFLYSHLCSGRASFIISSPSSLVRKPDRGK